MSFSASTKRELRHYVYGLVDPHDGSIFYVGRATANNRPFDHFRVDGGGRTPRRINEIRRSGCKPIVEILRYGLNSHESGEVEAAIIDVIGLENLTNLVRGRGVNWGRQKADDLEHRFGAKPLSVDKIKENLMLFFINQTFSSTMTEQQVYDCVRQFWYRVSPSTREPGADGKLEFPTALAVVESVVVRAYHIVKWFPAGATLSSREIQPREKRNRWEFVGQSLADSPIGRRFIGRRLVEGGKNLWGNELGYRYVPKRKP